MYKHMRVNTETRNLCQIRDRVVVSTGIAQLIFKAKFSFKEGINLGYNKNTLVARLKMHFHGHKAFLFGC